MCALDPIQTVPTGNTACLGAEGTKAAVKGPVWPCGETLWNSEGGGADFTWLKPRNGRTGV